MPLASSRGQENGPGICPSAVYREGGRGPLTHPQVGPHASPGTAPPFRRRAKLPKQINQSVKKPWRKDLSTVSAKKLKRGIVPGDEGGNNRHLLHGLCLRAPLSQLPPLLPTCPPRSTCGPGASPGTVTAPSHWLPGSARGQSHLSGGGREQSHCLASVPVLTRTLPSQKLNPLSVPWRPKDLSHPPCQWEARAHPRQIPSWHDHRNQEGEGTMETGHQQTMSLWRPEHPHIPSRRKRNILIETRMTQSR